MMNDRRSACDPNNNWSDRVNWATDEDWVRAVANLEAEMEVHILIGADLGNNLDVSSQIIPSNIDVEHHQNARVGGQQTNVDTSDP